jgi:hypothetical protein
MSNGLRGSISDKELEILKRKRKKILGMTKRTTQAGQEVFGDIDVSGFKGALSDKELEVAQDHASGDSSGLRSFKGAISDRELEEMRKALRR